MTDGTAWQPIDTCPENTWVLIWADWNEPAVQISRFRWRQLSEWEVISERSGASGARRQTRQEIVTREREWENGSGDYWMHLPDAPRGNGETTK